MISRYRAFREGQNIDKRALTARLPFSFVYYTVEGGDHLRVIVRSQRDQLPDQVGGLPPDDQMKIFDALFYMKVTALSPASSLNPIIPVSGLLARFNSFFSSERMGITNKSTRSFSSGALRCTLRPGEGRSRSRSE